MQAQPLFSTSLLWPDLINDNDDNGDNHDRASDEPMQIMGQALHLNLSILSLSSMTTYNVGIIIVPIL